MKKRLIILFIIFLLTGCQEKKEVTHQKKEVVKKEIVEIKENEIEEVENKVEIGLYQVEDGMRTLVVEKDIPWKQYQDIISLEAYYTKEEKLLEKHQKILWQECYDKYTDVVFF